MQRRRRTQRGEGHMQMETEIGGIQLQAGDTKHCWQPPEAGKG